MLCVRNTTELDFSGHAIEGSVRCHLESNSDIPGCDVCGIEGAGTDRSTAYLGEEPRAEKRSRRARGIKESTRWVEGMRAWLSSSNPLCDIRLPNLANRESDIFGLMRRARSGRTVRLPHELTAQPCAAPGQQAVVAGDGKQSFGRASFHDAPRLGQKARGVYQ